MSLSRDTSVDEEWECEEQQYVVGDALSVLAQLDDGVADIVHLDDAWARPRRCDYGNESAEGSQAAGTSYPTHPFDTDGAEYGADVTTSELLDESRRVLKDGGWLIMDVDDWLLPIATEYISEHWGNVAASYTGGGYRRIGGVTYVTKSDGSPDRSTAGMYLTNGGYPVLFAHKGETDRRTSESARQLAYQVRADHGWDSEKPIGPYETWIDGLTESGCFVVEPCAGTAPACIATEKLYGEDARFLAIDVENEARAAYERRRAAELGESQ